MTFDAVGFFQDRGIEYLTGDSGHKHARFGWIQIPCPFCTGNLGFHLGYNLEAGWWNCWRCGFHRTFDVLLALLGSRRAAKEAMEQYRGIEQPRRKKEKRRRNTVLELPPGLQPLTKRARRYLHSRKFDPDLIASFWKIQSTANYGYLSHRIYIPIYLNGEVVSWQCRDTTGASGLRYIGQSEDKEIYNNKDILYGIDNAVGESCLIVEGVTDVWRMGQGAVATFGIKYRPAQVIMLLQRFRNFHILFDPADPQAQVQADKLAHELAIFGRNVKLWLPDTDLDPGDMAQDDADAFMRDILGRASGY